MSGKKRDEEDASLEDSDDEEEEDRKRPKKRKKMERSFIDDAAEESGEEGGDDDEDDDDDDENDDYVKDDFVVDEGEEVEKKQKDDLEDSDDEDDDDDDDDDDDEGSDEGGDKKKPRRLQKLKTHGVLDEDDLALIHESKREDEPDSGAELQPERRPVVPVARSEDELRRGLFDQQEDDEEVAQKSRKIQKVRVEQYDEDGMDDFIDDDIGDQGEIMRSERPGLFDEETREVSEAQLNEASEIFGTDYLEFMGEDQPDQDEEELMGTYRERGVGVDYGVDSDEEMLSEDDDDLFEDDEDDEAMDGTTAQQKKEALRLKREKRRLAKAERRRQAMEKKAQRRKAQLRKAFEPVQLVENFCTDRDDDIRQSDVPERMYDWKTPFHGSEVEGLNAIEREQAQWIADKIPAISAEIAANENDRQMVLESIADALRYMHRDKLEPAFIKRYRRDYVVSPSVLDNLDAVLDQDAEFDRLIRAKQKVEGLLSDITVAADSLESQGADVQKLTVLQEQLDEAQKALDETATKETQIKHELEALGAAEDDDDELFGDDDGDDEEKKRERDRLSSHLSDLQMLLEAQAEKVSQLQSQVRLVEAQNRSLNDPGPVERITKKMCRQALWNVGDYTDFLTTLSDSRHVIDANRYLNLIKEGNEAIRKKELPALVVKDDPSEVRKRSRRFDRDFYRTCVSEGLRAVGYKFLLSPVRAGIKLEDTVTQGRFDFSRAMPGEDGDAVDPLRWVAPAVPSMTPSEFASDLIGSGELVLLSSTAGGEADAAEADDPFRGCRYVAAIELAHEPRIRRVLRDIFRKRALLSTRPTKKGTDTIDAFHDYYGLHLIRGKPVSSHFPLSPMERENRTSGLDLLEQKELDKEMRERERQSCIQYLHMLKAEQSGDIEIIIHLPFIELRDDWYKLDTELLTSRSNQDLSSLTNELEKVYLPLDVDVDQFNDERRKVIQQALTSFLLPQFEAEVRRELKDTAVRAGVSAAAENLREMAMVGPYRPAAIAHTENRFVHPTGDLPFVGVCCSSDAKDATYLAAVTERGESSDFLAVPTGMRVDSEKMREKVIMFLVQARPAAVIIGTSGGFESRTVQRKMVDLVKEAVERWNTRDIQGEDEDDEAFEARQALFRQMQPPGHYDDEEEDEWTCNVELIDDSVSQLFGRSVRSKKEFPDYSVNLKCAISIARYAKDPLSEITYAWSVASDAGVFGTEMLFLNIHPLQQLLPKTPLLRQYERVLCDVVADVGVDLNASCAQDHLRGLLTFVAGLGPRKAAFLKQTVTQMGGSIGRRIDLLQKMFLGPRVYNNAVAFLRIRETDQVVDHYVHPLDDTRLHPDVYLRNNWAIKIAFDALEREDPKGKEAAAIKAVRDVMEDSHNEVERLLKATKQEWEKNYGHAFNVKGWNPRVNVPLDMWRDKVEDLDLDAFASKLDEYGSGRWHSHLNMIKWEFRLPFADPRDPLESLSAEKLFHLITGETDQSLRPGKEITGKIVMNGDFGSRVKLEGDIPAFIPLRNISDEHVEAAEDYVSVGQVVTALVTEVKKDHMTVDLSLRKEDFEKLPSSWERPASLPRIDDTFDLSAAAKIEDDYAKKREARVEALLQSLGRGGDGGEGGGNKRRRVVRRTCTHPAFRNAKHSEVDRELKEAGAAMVGEALIRPSSKSSDSLAIHWVVREGTIKVIEVMEEDKETDASIGNVLKIKGESYGSIDELLGRCIAPMNDYVEELVNHRKFMDLPEDDVDQKLRAQKKANPSMIPYALCWMEMHPGYGTIRFIARESPRNHPFGITPRGFSWGSNTYSSLDKLIDVFKKNPQGPREEKKPPKPAAPKPAQPKQSRWAPKPPAPMPPAATAWDRPPPPPLPPAAPAIPATGGWGTASSIPISTNQGWSQQAPPPPPLRPPPPNLPPPPPAYGGLPPNFPPPNLPPPPPPPVGPPGGFGRPPPPPQGGFDFPPPEVGQGRGRGRGRTLPAWMSKG